MIDTHFHLIHTPDQETGEAIQRLDGLNQYRSLMDQFGITGGIIVQPSVYGFDNSLMLSALEKYPQLFKGVGSVPDSVTSAELESLKARGVVGVRLNLIDNPIQPELPTPDFFEKVRDANMYLQIHTRGEQLAEAIQIVKEIGVVLLVDHFGVPNPELGPDQTGFKEMIEGGIEGNLYIKLSAPFRISDRQDRFELANEFARTALDLVPLERFIAGTDWPFIRCPRKPHIGFIFQWLRDLLPNEPDWNQVAVTNARKLTGL